MPQCRKHQAATHSCPTCKGRGSISTIGGSSRCTSCNGTGQLCPKCGKHWRPY